MSFFSSLANAVADKVRRATGFVPPYNVVEVSVQQFAKSPVVVREELMTLFRENGNTFVAVLFIPGSANAFSLFRVTVETEATQLFNNFSIKLQPLMNSSARPRLLNCDRLQQLCDALRENPGWSCAHLAAKFTLIECFKNDFVASCLNAVDESTGVTPMHVAIESGDLECIKELLVRGVRLDIPDRNGCTIFHYAAKASSEQIIQFLASKDRSAVNILNAAGESPLHEACLSDRPQNVELLLRWGIDPCMTKSDRYPIHCAAKVSSIKCLTALYRWSRSQITLQDKKHGGTAVHWAETRECIYTLADFGANLDATNNDGETPLHSMIRLGHYDCVMGLLAKGANAALDGNNALHMAIEIDDADLVQLLIVFGADINGVNNDKVSPRHKAALSTGKNRDYILHLLHCVGAMRCPPRRSGCGPGCIDGGQFNGTPKIKQINTPDQQKKFHTGVMAEVAMAAAMTRSSSCSGAAIADQVDNVSLPNVRPSAGDRILCLDGGGIRGLVLIQLLQAIESVAGQPIKDCFDWIGGTSTGGILALAIVHGKSIRSCLGLYFQLKDSVFCGKRPYSSEPLEAFLKREFGETTRMSERDFPRVMVTGVLADRMPAELHLFRNYEVPGAEKERVAQSNNSQFQPLPRPTEQFVWRAARSSGAAPTYFRAFGRFLDGGLMSNNPTLDVMTEVHQFNIALRSVGEQQRARPIHVVVSLGTGRIPLKPVDACDVYRPEGIFDIAKVVFGAKNLAELLVDQATQSEGRAVERAAAWCSMIDVPYFRFSPQLSEDIPLDCSNDKVLVNMLWETQCYINEHVNRIAQLASLLVT